MFNTEDYCEEKLENLDAKVNDLNNLKNKKQNLEEKMDYIKNCLFTKKISHFLNYIFIILGINMNIIWFKQNFDVTLIKNIGVFTFILFVDFCITGMLYYGVTCLSKEKIDKYEKSHETLEKKKSKDLLLEESEKLSKELNDVKKLYALKEHHLDLAIEINEKKKKFEEVRKEYAMLRNEIDKSLAYYYWKQEKINAYTSAVNEEFKTFMDAPICKRTLENNFLGENKITEIENPLKLTLK